MCQNSFAKTDRNTVIKEKKMKKFTALVLLIALVVMTFAACGQSGGDESADAEKFDPSQVKVMGDVFPYEEQGDYQEGYSETDYVFVFTADGTYYRAKTEMPKDISDKIWAMDYSEDKDAKVRELIAPLEVKSLENLSELIPPQEELDKNIGRTGQELFDEGWEYWSYDLDEMKAGLYYGDFSYDVAFEYDGEPLENSDDFDFYENFSGLKVKSIEFSGLGDASDL